MTVHIRLPAFARAVLTVLASVGPFILVGGGSPAAAAPNRAESGAAAYVATTPCRVLDTRRTGDRLAGGATLTIDIAGSNCEIPSRAVAVAAVITAAEPAAPGHLIVWPAGTRRPVASVVNYDPRRALARANTVTARLSSAGGLSVYSLAASHVVVDIMGYWIPSEARSSGRAVAVGPKRILDTRVTRQRLPQGGTITVDVLAAGVPADAVAAFVNITVADPAAPGHVTAWSGAQQRPTASVLNYSSRDIRAGGTIVPLAAGKFTVYSHAAADVVVDVSGYITGRSAEATTDGLFVPVTPRRLLDTRLDTTPIFPAGNMEVAYRSNAALGSINVTMTQSWDAGWVRAIPSGTETSYGAASTSSVNTAHPNQTAANLSITPVAERGVAFTSSHGSHLVVDEYGYFVGQPSPSSHPSWDNPSPVKTKRRVVIISDSAMAGIRWNGALGALKGFVAEHDLESCRRLYAPSCDGREGYAPPTAFEEIELHAPPGPDDILVIAVGYNDWHANFEADITKVLGAARARGYQHIVWVTLRADNGYHLPRSGLKSNYRQMNDIVTSLAAGATWPELSIWNWEAYTSRVAPNTWFTADGVHQNTVGSFGAADWLSRHVAHVDSRPCPKPYGRLELPTPCPNPDTMPVRFGFYPALANLYGL